MDTVSNIIIIPALLLAIILHVLRVVYLLFKPKALTKYKSISGSPDKFHLFLYYTLTIIVLLIAIVFRLRLQDQFF